MTLREFQKKNYLQNKNIIVVYFAYWRPKIFIKSFFFSYYFCSQKSSTANWDVYFFCLILHLFYFLCCCFIALDFYLCATHKHTHQLFHSFLLGSGEVQPLERLYRFSDRLPLCLYVRQTYLFIAVFSFKSTQHGICVTILYFTVWHPLKHNCSPWILFHTFKFVLRSYIWIIIFPFDAHNLFCCHWHYKNQKVIYFLVSK